jgi:hypothetical protein
MTDKFQHLLERHPENEKTIRGLVEVSPEFRELVDKHHDVSERLKAATPGSPEAERGRLEAERKGIEQQLHILMTDHQRT